MNELKTSRTAEPSARWYRNAQRAFIAAGGWSGPATLRAIRPELTQQYRFGATAASAGIAVAEFYRLRKIAERLEWERKIALDTRPEPYFGIWN